MATEFKLPELGEGIDGGDVIEVLVSEGDQVDEGQTLLELETSKAAIPVPAPHAGRVAKIHVKAGDHVKVGQAMVTIEGDAKAAAAEPNDKKPSAAEKEPPPAQQSAPTSRAEKAEEKEPPAPEKEEKPPKEAPREIPPEQVPGRSKTEAPPRVKEESRPAELTETSTDLAPAGPATRRLARELGVDLRHVTGSGPGGRISEEDVKAFVRQMSAGRAKDETGPAAAALVSARQPPPLPDFSRWGPVAREPLASVRRKTAEHMSLAWSQIPQVTHFDEADITELEKFRKRHAEWAEARGGKLTVTVVALKAAAAALRAFPNCNSSLDPKSGELILKQYFHIGVAVDTDRGLLVPVIRDVDKRSLLDLAAELSATAERARQKKLSLDDLQGGTFTITNLGGIGGTAFSPIVNYPEVAILGLARAREQQVVRDGRAEIRLILPLCLSYDHRVIDGAAAARFTRRIVELLEDPFLMVLEG
jgi:pyruvate dehydrogenase E2 component (dihydrolipoamide acetyltransferase)